MAAAKGSKAGWGKPRFKKRAPKPGNGKEKNPLDSRRAHNLCFIKR